MRRLTPESAAIAVKPFCICGLRVYQEMRASGGDEVAATFVGQHRLVDADRRCHTTRILRHVRYQPFRPPAPPAAEQLKELGSRFL